MSASIIVIGSLNMDLVVTTPRHPKMSETILGTSFETFPGGKGANQAIAASRLGAQVGMIGKTGNDPFGQVLRENLIANHVDDHGVKVNSQGSSGVALITVDQNGMNSIIVVPGANATLTTSDLDELENVLSNANLILLQLEIPLETAWYAIRLARKHNIPVMLNPAPAASIPDEVLSGLDYLVPNESELSLLTGLPTRSYPEIVAACQELLKKGVQRVILTRGAQGCYYLDKQTEILLPAFRVRSIDSTAAGDAFIGGFATALVNKADTLNALQQASAAGALAVTKAGAQISLPSRKEMDEFLTTIEQSGGGIKQ